MKIFKGNMASLRTFFPNGRLVTQVTDITCTVCQGPRLLMYIIISPSILIIKKRI